MRSILALVVVALAASQASAGPVREWVRQHRPGIIVPKRTAPSCVCGDACACPAGNCPAKCPVQGAAVPQPVPAKADAGGRVIVGYQCVNGKCYPVYAK